MVQKQIILKNAKILHDDIDLRGKVDNIYLKKVIKINFIVWKFPKETNWP